jgi:hypothetical protein
MSLCFDNSISDTTDYFSLRIIYSPSFTVTLQIPERMEPKVHITTADNTQGAQTIGSEKCNRASTPAKADDCIPTSIELVLAILSERPKTLEMK